MPSDAVVIELPDVAATHQLAATLAADLEPGSVVALTGELGAGKTEFVRGLARALGVPDEAGVCSPSYLLLNVYAGGEQDLAHFDAYFMGRDGTAVDDLERAGLADLIAEGAIVAIEWADLVEAALPPSTVWIALEADEMCHRARVSTGASGSPTLTRRGDAL
jgi:tRNA threonylcarbamoyladenosine biosynthesis protein TsaE